MTVGFRISLRLLRMRVPRVRFVMMRVLTPGHMEAEVMASSSGTSCACVWQLQAGSSGRPRAFGCRAIYNHKASVSGRSLREVFRGGVCGHRAGPALLSLTTACAPIGRAMDEGPAALTFALHGGPVGGDGAQGEKIGLPGSASHTVSGGGGVCVGALWMFPEQSHSTLASEP